MNYNEIIATDGFSRGVSSLVETLECLGCFLSVEHQPMYLRRARLSKFNFTDIAKECDFSVRSPGNKRFAEVIVNDSREPSIYMRRIVHSSRST